MRIYDSIKDKPTYIWHLYRTATDQLVESVMYSLSYDRYGKLTFDSGEGAWDIATMSKDSSRHETYSLSLQLEVEIIINQVEVISNLSQVMGWL